jgi:type IV pilus assembly protein PilC
MRFRVTIRKEGASDEERAIEADSRFAVYDQIKREDGVVVKLVEVDTAFALPSWVSITMGTGVKQVEVIRLARNLSAMLTADLSLSRALSVIGRQSENKRLKAVADGISELIRKGESFHGALAAYPKVFPALFIAMVRAGEESGTLSEALATIGTQMERSEELMRKIRGAMIYPAIVLTAIMIVGILMLVYVVPTLTATFTQLGVAIPLTTQIIVAVSNFMVANSVFVALGLVVLVLGGTAFVRSRQGSTIILATSLHLPVVGELVRETYAARTARTLSSLLASGVPVLEALTITKEVVRAEAFGRVIEKAAAYVQRGDALSSAFSEDPGLYPILMSDMLAIGEETGKVAEMLRQIAEFYETDVAEKTKDLSTIIEPVLMLVIGTFVGIFAVSMIAPIYSLSSAF